MQIVIDIKDDDYYDIIGDTPYMFIGEYTTREVINAVKNGIPLPKGHGRLVDISKIEKDKIEKDNPIICLTIDDNYTEAISLDYLDNLPTIVEADKEDEE